MADLDKRIVLIGGPNGAGKTEWAVRKLWPTLGIKIFINADEIARGLSPLAPDRADVAAGRIMLDRLDELTAAGESFAFEATCAGRGHGRLLKKCRSSGYQIMFLFLWLPSLEAALERVARRVARGGNNIAPDVVIRRYRVGLRNMRNFYLPLTDTAIIIDNSDRSGELIAEYRSGSLRIHDPRRWSQIEEATR